jgi:hypothetical protein
MPSAATRDATRAYRSKIGRLPWSVRNELCERLLDGASGTVVLRWINAHPAFKKTKTAPVNAQNLTAWRGSGYAVWLREREKAHQVREYAETASHIAAAAGGDPAAVGARILAGKLLGMLEAVDAETAHDFATAVAHLRKGEADAAKLDLDRQKAGIAQQALDLEKAKFKRLTCELFVKWYKNKKVAGIMDDATTDSDQKTEALGRTLFGDLWSA